MTLVDTSVWISFLRNREANLRELLRQNQVLMHPFVLGELLLGNVTSASVPMFRALPSAPVASDHEVRRLIEVRRLAGKGIGYVDVHLLASALLARASVWTEDRRLRAMADGLAITWNIPSNG
jgi:predicted nucleic acid-binding protein